MKTSVHAIEADALVKTYGDVRALDGLSLAVPAGHGLRPARAERRRQVDDRAHPHHAVAAGRGRGARGRPSTCCADPGAVRRAIGCVGQRSGVDLEATGAENLILQGQIHGLRGRDLAARVAELLDQFGLARPAGGS